MKLTTLSEKKKGQIRTVADETYKEAVWRSGKKVFLILGAEWCSDSRNLLENVLPSYVEKYSDKILFLSAEVESGRIGEVLNPKIKAEFDVHTYPTIIVFDDGVFLDERSPEESKGKGSQERAVRKLLFALGIEECEF